MIVWHIIIIILGIYIRLASPVARTINLKLLNGETVFQSRPVLGTQIQEPDVTNLLPLLFLTHVSQYIKSITLELYKTEHYQ